MANKPRRPSQDELLDLLHPDPAKQIQGFKIVSAWVGKSPHVGYWRLYQTPELDEWIEVQDSDIIATWTVDASKSPLGGTTLAINDHAELRSMGSETVNASMAFLQGRVTEDFAIAAKEPLRAMAAIGLGGGPLGDKDYTKGFWCNVSMLFSCTTHVVEDNVCTLASGKLCGTARLLP